MADVNNVVSGPIVFDVSCVVNLTLNKQTVAREVWKSAPVTCSLIADRFKIVSLFARTRTAVFHDRVVWVL